MLQAYDEGRLDKLYIVSNKFVNTMSQEPQVLQLLPLPPADDEELKKTPWDYLYEPDPKVLLDTCCAAMWSRRFIRASWKTWPASRPHEWSR